jgi:hypothetical protein
MDALNRMMRTHALPKRLRRRLREYFHQARHLTVARATEHVLHTMSPLLQQEVCPSLLGSHSTHIVSYNVAATARGMTSHPNPSHLISFQVTLRTNCHWLDYVWFLRGVESACAVQIAMAVSPLVFVPTERPPPQCLYVIHRGALLRLAPSHTSLSPHPPTSNSHPSLLPLPLTPPSRLPTTAGAVLYEGRLLTRHKCWGEDVILSSDRYRSPGHGTLGALPLHSPTHDPWASPSPHLDPLL